MSEQIPTPKTWFQRFVYELTRQICWFGFRIFNRMYVSGREKIPQSGAVLICPNHQSHLDPVIVGSCSVRRMNFLAKKQLFSIPPLSWMISFLDSIPIDREGMSAGGIKETLKRLKRNEMVLMFPEGTRTPDGELKKVLPGFCALARRTNARLLPVGIDGAYDSWPRRRLFPVPFRKLAVVFGDPIPPEDYLSLTEEEMVKLLENRIRECMTASRRARRGEDYEPGRVSCDS